MLAKCMDVEQILLSNLIAATYSIVATLIKFPTLRLQGIDYDDYANTLFHEAKKN